MYMTNVEIKSILADIDKELSVITAYGESLMHVATARQKLYSLHEKLNNEDVENNGE